MVDSEKDARDGVQKVTAKEGGPPPPSEGLLDGPSKRGPIRSENGGGFPDLKVWFSGLTAEERASALAFEDVESEALGVLLSSGTAGPSPPSSSAPREKITSTGSTDRPKGRFFADACGKTAPADGRVDRRFSIQGCFFAARARANICGFYDGYL